MESFLALSWVRTRWIECFIVSRFTLILFVFIFDGGRVLIFPSLSILLTDLTSQLLSCILSVSGVIHIVTRYVSVSLRQAGTATCCSCHLDLTASRKLRILVHPNLGLILRLPLSLSLLIELFQREWLLLLSQCAIEDPLAHGRILNLNNLLYL